MGRITFKEGGSITFKGGTLTFLSYTPMAEPTVTASWTYSGGKYKSQVVIENNDTEIARMWYRIDGSPPTGKYQNINPGDTYTITKYNSSTLPPYGTTIEGKAYAADPNGLRDPSETVTHTAVSPNPPMVDPTVTALWLYQSGQYIKRVSIKNNDTWTVNMWYRLNDNPPAGSYTPMSPGETRTFTISQSPSKPSMYAEVKGEARATGPENTRNPSQIITDIAIWPGDTVANPTVSANWRGSSGNWLKQVTVKNNDAQTVTIYAGTSTPPTTSFGDLGPGATKTITIETTAFEPAPGITFKAYVQMKKAGRYDSAIISSTSSGFSK